MMGWWSRRQTAPHLICVHCGCIVYENPAKLQFHRRLQIWQCLYKEKTSHESGGGKPKTTDGKLEENDEMAKIPDARTNSARVDGSDNNASRTDKEDSLVEIMTSEASNHAEMSCYRLDKSTSEADGNDGKRPTSRDEVHQNKQHERTVGQKSVEYRMIQVHAIENKQMGDSDTMVDEQIMLNESVY